MDLLNIVQWYTDYFATQVPAWEGFAFIYAWLAVASLATLLFAVVTVIFKREAGATTAALVGQHVLVYAVPYLIAGILPFIDGGTTAAVLGGGIA